MVETKIPTFLEKSDQNGNVLKLGGRLVKNRPLNYTNMFPYNV